MPQIQLTVQERKVHRAEAHHLDPVVMIGNDGLTPNVHKEIDAALIAHGLIKVRVLTFASSPNFSCEIFSRPLAALIIAALIGGFSVVFIFANGRPR